MVNWKAVRFMVISTTSFTVMNALAKYLSDFPAFEIIFFRSLGSLVLCMFFLLKNRIPILGNQRKLLAARGISGLIAMSAFFVSLQMLPLASVVSLRYLSPVFAAIFGIYLLKERMYKLQFLFFGMAIIGVVMIKGFDLRVSALGLTYIMIAALFSGLVYVIIRKIGEGDHPIVIVNYFMFTTTLVGGIVSLFYWKTPEGIEWLLFLSLGIFGFFGQLFMTRAFQIERPSIVAPFKYIEVIYSLGIGLSVFGEGYSFLSFSGILLIIGGMFLNVTYKPKKKGKKLET